MKIELVKWDLEHKAELCRLCNGVDRSYLSDRIPYPYQDGDAEWWIGMTLEQEGKGGIFRAILVDGAYAGTISVEQKEDVYLRDGEIGYYLLKEYAGKGVMTEAVRRICEEAFAVLPLLRITGLVYEPNMASRRVLEKNGFVPEGRMRQAVWKDQQVYDLCIYGKLRD